MTKLSCRMALTAMLAVCLLLAAQSCREKPAQSGSKPPGTVAEAQNKEPDSAGANKLAGKGPRQILLMYTGDTISAVEPNRTYNPPEGGLPALAHTILEYEAEILELTRKRVANEGGDPEKVRADLPGGMLGEHPFLLLDYGGWERPNDHFGTLYVQMFFDYARSLNYTNVASLGFETMSLERWNDYLHLNGYPNFIASTAHRTVPGWGPIRVRALDLLGAHWGIVSIPELTEEEKKAADGKVWKARIEEAAGYLKDENCSASILIAVALPRAAYDALKNDPRFTVLIGCPTSMAPPEGYGEMPQGGPLMLPQLFAGGRQLGICHLIYSEQGSIPMEYNFMLRKVTDDESQPYPLRKQCQEAAKRHAEFEKTLK